MQATTATEKIDSRGRVVERSEAVGKIASTLLPGKLAWSFSSWFRPGDRAIGDESIWGGGSPPVITKGKGATVVDVDGNEYLDFIGAHGVLILGHADERVVAAISKAASKGTSYGTPSEMEVRLAELIAGRFSTIDMVQLVHTPADALVYAVELARRYTGRHHLVTFEGAWHNRIRGVSADLYRDSRRPPAKAIQ